MFNAKSRSRADRREQSGGRLTGGGRYTRQEVYYVEEADIHGGRYITWRRQIYTAGDGEMTSVGRLTGRTVM